MADPASPFADFASTAENVSDVPTPAGASNSPLRDKAIRNIYAKLQEIERMTTLLPAQKIMRRDILIQEEIERLEAELKNKKETKPEFGEVASVDINTIMHPHPKAPLPQGRGTPALTEPSADLLEAQARADFMNQARTAFDTIKIGQLPPATGALGNAVAVMINILRGSEDKSLTFDKAMQTPNHPIKSAIDNAYQMTKAARTAQDDQKKIPTAGFSRSSTGQRLRTATATPLPAGPTENKDKDRT